MKKKNVFIIAEAGVNHNGSIEIAKNLVDVAKIAGADAVKFQTFTADKLVTKYSPKARYQRENTGISENHLEMLKRLELSKESFAELYEYCAKNDIMFMSTPFDVESADMLDKLGMSIFKISSGEITNRPLLRHIAAKGKPIILSTGMSYIEEVEKAIKWLYEPPCHSAKKSSKPGARCSLALLHCTSSYPCPVKDANLNAIRTLQNIFHLPVGFSDHTPGIEVAIAAVALGATIIEKHLTLDRNMQGPDHKASLIPGEFRSMVCAVRNVENAMGDGIKRPARHEIDTRKAARRSIVALHDIAAGSIMEGKDIGLKRPGTGIAPEFMDVIIGMELKRDVKDGSIITWEDLKNT